MYDKRIPDYIRLSFWRDEECGVEDLFGFSGMEEDIYLDNSGRGSVKNLRRQGLLKEVEGSEII